MAVVIRAKSNLAAGLQDLWTETLGESEVCVAVLDGLVDQSHPSLIGAEYLNRLKKRIAS